MLQLNGGPLGGTASFQRLTTEMRAYSTIATFGHGIGPEPMALVAGPVSASRRAVRRPGSVLRLAGVLAGRRSVRRTRCAATRSSRSRRMGICRTPISSRRNEARSAMRIYTSTVELGLRVSQQLYLEQLLRRRKSVGAAARLRSDAAVPRCRIRCGARHSARSVGRRSRIWIRPGGCARAARIPSGRFISSSVRSSNSRSFSCVPCFARRRSRS